MSDVVKSYCEAIYNVSLKNNLVENYKNNIKEVILVIKENNDLKKLFDNPNITKEDKKGLIEKIFKYDEMFISFLKVLVENNRFSLIEEIFLEYSKLANEYLKIEEAEIISAAKLTDNELSDIREMLEKKLNKRVEITQKTDEKLMAGIRVILKNEVIDNSMETKLNNLKNIILNRRVG